MIDQVWNCLDLRFSRHAVERMFERKISPEDVREAIRTGEVIEEYPHDQPFRSRLILWTVENRPLHVVVAFEEVNGRCHVITVYEPEPTFWDDGFRRRIR